jgi:hypothetical protein
MKFWEFITVFRSENLHYDINIFEELLDLRHWEFLKNWYNNIDNLVLKKTREELDYMLPYDFCIEAFSRSQRKYYLIEDTYLTTCHSEYPEPSKPYIILTALEVFKRYGGSCMVEVQERIQYDVRTKLTLNV